MPRHKRFEGGSRLDGRRGGGLLVYSSVLPPARCGRHGLGGCRRQPAPQGLPRRTIRHTSQRPLLQLLAARAPPLPPRLLLLLLLLLAQLRMCSARRHSSPSPCCCTTCVRTRMQVLSCCQTQHVCPRHDPASSRWAQAQAQVQQAGPAHLQPTPPADHFVARCSCMRRPPRPPAAPPSPPACPAPPRALRSSPGTSPWSSGVAGGG
jgi:hypothetical protein